MCEAELPSLWCSQHTPTGCCLRGVCQMRWPLDANQSGTICSTWKMFDWFYITWLMFDLYYIISWVQTDWIELEHVYCCWIAKNNLSSDCIILCQFLNQKKRTYLWLGEGFVLTDSTIVIFQYLVLVFVVVAICIRYSDRDIWCSYHLSACLHLQNVILYALYLPLRLWSRSKIIGYMWKLSKFVQGTSMENISLKNLYRYLDSLST